MAIVTAQHTYSAPKDKVFAVFADIGNVHETNPALKGSRRRNDTPGMGGRRECHFGGKAGIHEEVTAFAPGERIQFTGVKIWGVPVESMVATFDLAEEENRTTVMMNMDFQSSLRLLNPILAAQNRKVMGVMLKGAEKKL